MLPSDVDDLHDDLMKRLLQLGSNVKAAICMAKPLYNMQKLTISTRLSSSMELMKTQKTTLGMNLVNLSSYENRWLSVGKKSPYPSIDIAKVLNTNPVKELSKRKLVETIRIYSQSHRPQESSEEATWNIWTQNELIRLNRRLSQLKPSVQQFIKRLADSIKEDDWRFECQPILVGSAEEGTQAVISAEIDSNFKLIKFSQFCDPFQLFWMHTFNWDGSRVKVLE